MKAKVLSCAVMAAFFALGMTSCEKENFTPNVNIDAPEVEIPEVVVPEGYKPGDAVVSIQPTVLAVINGETKNVTEDENTTITYNGEEGMFVPTLNADKGIDAIAVEVVATYKATIGEETKTLTATTIVRVPKLAAGQVAVFTPTMIMSLNVEVEEPGDEPGDEPGEEPGEDTEKVSLGLVTEANELETVATKTPFYIEFDNNSNYYFTGVTDNAGGNLKKGSFISNIKVEAAYSENAELQAILGSYNQGIENYSITVKNFNLWPNTKTCFKAEQIVETKNYIIKESFETRATEEVKAATFTVTNYAYIISTTPEYYNSGAGHNGHGHEGSHGHGHGTGNAGGGIIYGL